SDFRVHFKRGDELQVLALFVDGGLEGGHARWLDVFLLDSLDEAVAHQLIQHLGAHGLAETALDLGHWYLAGTETVQTQVLAGILEARRHGGFQFFGGYTGGQASFQTRRRFNRNLHNFLLYKYGNSVTGGTP